MTQYKLTEETKEYKGITLHRIELNQDCKWGKKGDKGGWIQSEKNLSEDAWIGGEACVYGNAKVYGNANIYGDAWVCGNAQVYGNAHVYGNAKVSGDAQVYGYAIVSGDAIVYGDAWVYGDAIVYGDAWVYGNAQIYGDAHVFDNVRIDGGKWDTEPLYLNIPNGPTMNMSEPGILRIGNEHKSINDWLKDETYQYRSFVWWFAEYYGL